MQARRSRASDHRCARDPRAAPDFDPDQSVLIIIRRFDRVEGLSDPLESSQDAEGLHEDFVLANDAVECRLLARPIPLVPPIRSDRQNGSLYHHGQSVSPLSIRPFSPAGTGDSHH